MLQYKELIKEWHRDGFNLRLYYTGKKVNERICLSYRFSDTQAGVVFSGDDFFPSPLYAIDSIKVVYALLGFLSLQPGDTDQDYFDNYTPEQLAWCESSRCDQLGMIIPEKYL